jgi:hypothetical protein
MLHNHGKRVFDAENARWAEYSTQRERLKATDVENQKYTFRRSAT